MAGRTERKRGVSWQDGCLTPRDIRTSDIQDIGGVFGNGTVRPASLDWGGPACQRTADEQAAERASNEERRPPHRHRCSRNTRHYRQSGRGVHSYVLRTIPMRSTHIALTVMIALLAVCGACVRGPRSEVTPPVKIKVENLVVFGTDEMAGEKPKPMLTFGFAIVNQGDVPVPDLRGTMSTNTHGGSSTGKRSRSRLLVDGTGHTVQTEFPQASVTLSVGG